MAKALRVLVVDDEAAARRHALSVLATDDAVQVVGECSTGTDAVVQIRDTAPDVVLLDVSMPGLDGFGVIAAIGPERMPPCIFASAYSEFAVRAFEAYAVDYLLKPIEGHRMSEALRRVRALPLRVGEAASRLTGLVNDMNQHRSFPTALAVRGGAQFHVVRVSEVQWIAADGNYAILHLQKQRRIVGRSLTALENDVLDPAQFVRVHKSAIVNIERVATLEPSPSGDATLVLIDGTRVPCSRRYRRRIEALLLFLS